MVRVAVAVSLLFVPSSQAAWAVLPSRPFLTTAGVTVWTGRHLVTWSGETPAGGYAAIGAAFDRAEHRWVSIPAGPLRPRSWAGATWTGNDVVVWGGAIGDVPVTRGAAFNPGTRRWRLLPPAPLTPRVPVATAWTGREVLVWGDRSRVRAKRDGAAYDPRTNRWRRLRSAPFALNDATGVWTGSELIVVGALLDGSNNSRTRHARAIAYRPRRDTWRVLPSPQLSPQASYAVWTGRDLLVWDYELQASAYAPAANVWRVRPRLPIQFGECSPLGARIRLHVLAWHCGQAAVFDIRRQTWSRVRGPSTVFAGTPVAAGHEFFVLALDRLWSYRPG